MTVLAVDAPPAVRLPESQTVTWNPLAKQQLERDTLFLLDPDYELTETAGEGAILPQPLLAGDGTYSLPSLWTGGSECYATTGKYRRGMRVTGTSTSWPNLQGEILPADQFTVEMWVQADHDWAALSGRLLDFQGAQTLNYFQIQILSNQVQVNYHHLQSGTVNTTLSYNLSASPVLANQWVNLAVTFSTANKLTIYRDGVQVAQSAALTPPYRWTPQLVFLNTGADVADFTISDLRISRYCRVPNQSITVRGHATLSVDPTTTTGTVQKKLLGTLHGFGTSGAEAQIGGALKVIRTDKLLVATPIKAGATDATHPTLGHSGAYSYDWQVVDRTFDYIVNTLGCEPYISIDATPQVLGGSVAPFTGTNLTTQRSSASNFPSDHPSDNAEFAKIVGDLVYYVTVTKGYSVPYWGVWNEPDGNFWSGASDAAKRSTYYPMYAAVANAVKAIDSNLKVGGPETSSIDQTWIDGLIAYCQTNSVPLDFISCHFYDNDETNGAGRARGYVETARSAHSFTGALEIINGEWAWSTFYQNRPPWDTLKANVGDYGASFYGRQLIDMQRYNVVRSILADPDTSQAYITNGTLMTPTHTWANLNVFKQWAMLKDTIVSSTLTGPPHLDAICTKSGSTVDVFLANHRYSKATNQTVDISLSGYNGSAVTVYVVDDAHSNYLQAGAAHADLESYDGGTVASGTVSVTLRPRSTALVRIG